MKWNWGKGIVLSFVLFCSFVIYVVVRAFQQDMDLVSNTYYLEELDYQNRINEKSNLAQSGEEVTLQQMGDEVFLLFPESFQNVTGEIHFYHPSRSLFDKFFPIKLVDGKQTVDKGDLMKGRFKVKINWVANDIAYYQETDVFIK